MKKTLGLAFISTLAFSTLAFSASEKVYNQSLLNKYYESINAVKKQEKVCQESAVILPKNTFNGVEISEKELFIVLNYFYFKAEVSCSKSSHHDYYASSILLRLTDKKTEHIIDASDKLISKTFENFIKSEVSYSTLPSDLRGQVENILILKAPFLSLESLDNINL